MARQSLCVVLSGSDLDEAYKIVQHYANAANYVLLGPRLWSIYGADAARRLLLLNESRGRHSIRIILDARLYGTAQELRDIVSTLPAAYISGVTVAASSGAEALAGAVESANDISRLYTTPFILIAYGMPDALPYRTHSSAYRDARLRRMVAAAVASGVPSCIVQDIDWTMLRSLVPEMSFVVSAERPAIEPRRACGKGVQDWLDAGANMVLYDPLILCKRYVIEDDADVLHKMVIALAPPPQKIHVRRSRAARAARDSHS